MEPAKGRVSEAKTVKVKEEHDASAGKHQPHRFIVKYSLTDVKKYPVDCYHPCTVLEALKSTETYHENIKCSDEKVVIQLGKGDGEIVVATHFPCSCIMEGEVLFILSESKKVEEAKDQQRETIHSKEKYSVFFIDTVGGLNTKQKKLFRNNSLKDFKYLCVYGEKGVRMTVEEALRRDGRFVDYHTDFTLTDNANPHSIMNCSQIVDKLDKGFFKICLPRVNYKKQKQYDTRSAAGFAHQRAVSVRAAEDNGSSADIQEIYDKLCQQFPDLKKLMESRFPADSYEKALSLRKEDFGKIQHSFSEIHRVRKLLKLGKSVCKVSIQDMIGSGFVLFDNFILTSAHLFKGLVEGEQLKEGISIYAIFNYEEPEPHTNFYYFRLAHRGIFCSPDVLDYAVFEIDPEGYKPKQTPAAASVTVPPGLLKSFGPIPQTGEGCIIGHPGGALKKMDPICIICKEKREQAVSSNLDDIKDDLFTLCAINHAIETDPCADVLMTYNSFMYHGSSGSPVVDVHGRVIGLHTGGFFFGFPKADKSVIEYGYPALRIFGNFVTKLKERGYKELLNRIEDETKGNSDLKKVFNNVMDSD